MAEVWMGRRASVGGATKSVAIKFMSTRVAKDERHRRMFLAEARLSMLMNHSNVVPVFDAGEDGGRLFLVMEWIDGLNLAQLCELRRQASEPWPPQLVGYIMGEVLQGLGYAHHLIHEGRTQCVVHRDVSPHNVLVSTSGEVKLADFGVARLSAEETSGMHIKGKLRYMAPEHLAGRSREPTVDLYGAGAILHELLTGQRFREEADEVDLYGHILGGRIPPLSTPGVPPELASLREGLLQSRVQQRIPTASRALEYLSAWAGYRNEAASLGQLCRAYMGVSGPSSGIDSGVGAVDAHADTVTPPAVTKTSDSGPPRDSVVVVGVSGAATRPDGPPQPRSLPSSQPQSRRGWLGVVGALGVGLGVGGVGWLLLRSRGEMSPPAGAPREVASVASPPDPVVAASSTGEGGGSGELGSSGGSTTGGVSSGEHAVTGASTTGAPPEITPPTTAVTTGPEPVAPDPRPRVRKATVKFGLRSPQRLAWVRIGQGKAFVVDVVAERRVSPGRRRIYWKGAKDGVWVDGGSFTFAPGERYQIRLTTRGPVLE